MKVTVFSAKAYDRQFLDAANEKAGCVHQLNYLEPLLEAATAQLAAGAEAVCAFVHDHLTAAVLEELSRHGVRLVALRSTGFNNVDLPAAARCGVTIARVPAYSPYAVAEHAVALMLSLNRKIHRAYVRVREGNFALEGLLGFDMHGRTVGIIGTGAIGFRLARILAGLGCVLLGVDPVESSEFIALGGRYVALPELLAGSDVISLHCPLTSATHHIIGSSAIEQMKRGVMLINTSRGAVIDTPAAIEGLKSGRIGSLGLDVYEEEDELFFEDKSDELIYDDVFARLLTFPNVLITGHQGFFTVDALTAIAETTIANIDSFARRGVPLHPVQIAAG
jgi:D-lactate dehydrogenase